jgi:hypothetical protein
MQVKSLHCPDMSPNFAIRYDLHEDSWRFFISIAAANMEIGGNKIEIFFQNLRLQLITVVA